ncbi:MAG: hypothetical protein Fur0041_21730 [Bacteroidia bacterium]
MKSFQLSDVRAVDDVNLASGVFLLIYQPLRLPPHILLSIDGKLFSISVAGVHEAQDAAKFITFIHRKKAPVLFLELLLNPKEVDALKKVTVKMLRQYGKVTEGKVSCLYPVRDALAHTLDKEFLQAGFVFELTQLLKEKGRIKNSCALYMKEELRKGSFEFLLYSNDQLFEATKAARLKYEKTVHSAM